jgi:hypothetical protein
VKINIMRHRIGLGIDQRHLNVVALVGYDDGRRDRAVVSHRLQFGSLLVDDDLLLFDHEGDFQDLRPRLGSLLVRRHKGRCHEIDLLARQLGSWIDTVFGGGGSDENGGNDGGHRCDISGDHVVPHQFCGNECFIKKQLQIVNFMV